MIEGLKPYAESAKTKAIIRTSEINIPWLVAIPKHWKVIRSKGLFTARTERAREDDEQLSATQAYGVIPQKEFESRVGRKVVRITQHLEKRAHVEPDDFVISMRSFQGGLERAWARGCIRSSYVVLKPSPETVVGYFAHLFKSLDYIRALQATSNFIRDGQDLNFNNFSLVDLPLPPLDEQAAIAKCLDHANRKIDGFIRAKRKLIGLLNEQKQAIIHRAVTRGLDPDVPVKPSGIPWLGDIPAHWETITVGASTTLIQTGPFGSQVHSHEYVRGGTPIVNPSHMKNGSIVSDPGVAVSDGKLRELARHRMLVGDIVVARRGELGRCALVTKIEEGWLCGTGSLLVRVKRDVFNPGYFQEVFSSAGVCDLLRLASVGATMDNLNAGMVGRLRFPLPSIEEQAEILKFIGIESTKNKAAISVTEREIALMQEYRTRLTADIVTGNLDVREAAAKLPDLPTDPAAEAISDEVLDDSEIEDAEA